MKLFHRKSRWERLVEPVATSATNAIRRTPVRGGVAAALAAIGMSAASAVVSSRRQKDKR